MSMLRRFRISLISVSFFLSLLSWGFYRSFTASQSLTCTRQLGLLAGKDKGQVGGQKCPAPASAQKELFQLRLSGAPPQQGPRAPHFLAPEANTAHTTVMEPRRFCIHTPVPIGGPDTGLHAQQRRVQASWLPRKVCASTETPVPRPPAVRLRAGRGRR